MNTQDDFQVVGTAQNGLGAMDLLNKGLQTDIVLTDLNMKGMDGIELSANVAEHFTDAQVIILTMHTKVVFLKRAVDAGARGYLLKNGNVEEIFTAIREVHDGKMFVGEDSDESA